MIPVSEAIKFTVHGTPQTAGSKRAFIVKTKGGGQRAIVTDDNAKGKDWKGDVKRAALDALNPDHQLLTGPLRVEFEFRIQRPQGHFGSGKNSANVKPSAPTMPDKKPDVLKLARCVEDALTGIVWADDAQITSETLYKRFCEPGEGPRCLVLIAKDVA